LGKGLPWRDLTVTADHALVIDGVLCHAGALVNGTSIIRVPIADFGATVTLYHIETRDHRIILAEGTAAETFVDTNERRGFDNFAEYQALFPVERAIDEMPYPRAMSARQIPSALRARFGLTTAA